MMRRVLVGLLISSLMGAACGTAPAAICESGNTPVVVPVEAAVSVSVMTPLERAMFDDINALRVRNGLPPLAPDPALITLARERSADMAVRNYFSHTTPEGLSVFDLMDERGVTYAFAGENLAQNNYPEADTEQVAFSGLVTSHSHLENMLSPNYNRMGVGVIVNGDGRYYFTILFTGKLTASVFKEGFDAEGYR